MKSKFFSVPKFLLMDRKFVPTKILFFGSKNFSIGQYLPHFLAKKFSFFALELRKCLPNIFPIKKTIF